MFLIYIRFFIFFLIFVLFIYLMYSQSLLSLLWFCKVSLILLLIALLFDSDYLYSTALVSQSIVTIIFITEVICLFIFNYSPFNLAAMYDGSEEWLISIFYHLLITGVSFFMLFKKKVFVKDAWIFSTALFFFFSFVIYFSYYTGYLAYNDFFINCAGYCPNFGVITIISEFLYSLTPIPNFLINTIVIGTIFYLLSILYYRILNKKNKKKFKEK